jgi:hypothetical protein
MTEALGEKFFDLAGVGKGPFHSPLYRMRAGVSL